MKQPIAMVQSSIDKHAAAVQIANTLVAEKLCACFHIIGPLTSVYRWQGRLVNEKEYLLNAKTPAAKTAALKARLIQLHTYELPEVVVLPINDASADYAHWVYQQCA